MEVKYFFLVLAAILAFSSIDSEPVRRFELQEHDKLRGDTKLLYSGLPSYKL